MEWTTDLVLVKCPYLGPGNDTAGLPFAAAPSSPSSFPRVDSANRNPNRTFAHTYWRCRRKGTFMVQSLSAANGTRLTYCFLSDLVGKKVYGHDYGLIGKVVDLVATHDDRCPELKGLVLVKSHSTLYFQVDSTDLLGLARSARFIMPKGRTWTALPHEEHFLVRETLYDKQIVDINGAKVERVNDVRILFSGTEPPRLDCVDVGFTGLARRLGWETNLRRWLKSLLGRQLKDELIAWRFVQPLPESVSSPIRISLKQEQIKRLHAGELADIIEDLDRDERVSLVQSLTAERAAEVLDEADLDVQTAILRDLDTELAADILEEMEPAAAVDVIDKLPADTQQSIMAAMEEDDRTRLEPLVQAKADSAASLMTVNFLSCPETYTVAETLEFVRHNAEEIEFISYVFCVDENSSLTGVASLRNLMVAAPDSHLSQIANRRLATLSGDEDWEMIANLFLKYRFKALPVVDKDFKVAGIVTFKHSFDELLSCYYKLAS